MQYKYQSFIIEKIGKRYYISPEWLRMNNEICAETKTFWGAKKWVRRHGTKWLEEHWSDHYYNGSYTKNNRL